MLVARVTTIGIVSPGAMGSALGTAFTRGGSRVVATADGRSGRTARLLAAAEIDPLPGLEQVVAAADIVLSVVPPADARRVAAAVAELASRAGVQPLVADLNAISPATARGLAAGLREAGLELVDGSISGSPPRDGSSTRLYLSGARAGEISALAASGVEMRVVGPDVGAASAVKMCTASVYKGQLAVLTQALRAAAALGVLEIVVDDLGTLAGDGTPAALARGAAKAHRYVGEMQEIAATQASVGLTPALFEAMGEVYSELAGMPAGSRAPEEIERDTTLEDALRQLAS
jgi:3-hydroxyisobutyrate dehydrogenase-like beta-hydroxyacid dehydrogenase